MNKKTRKLWEIIGKMSSDKSQSITIMVIFGILGVAALVGSFWHWWQLIISGMCIIMFLCGLSDFNKQKKNYGKERCIG